MSAAPPVPLEIGARQPIVVSIRELGGKRLTVQRINGRSLAALRAFQADPDNTELAWAVARACAPGLTDEDMIELSIDSVTKIIWLASAELALVEEALGNGSGPATGPA